MPETEIPCETCERPTSSLGTKRCDWCWEVESRLEDYLRRGGLEAWAFVVKALAKVVG
jgi:hypothetical protein